MKSLGISLRIGIDKMARMYFLNCMECAESLATNKEAEIQRFKKEHEKHGRVLIGY